MQSAVNGAVMCVLLWEVKQKGYLDNAPLEARELILFPLLILRMPLMFFLYQSLCKAGVRRLHPQFANYVRRRQSLIVLSIALQP